MKAKGSGSKKRSDRGGAPKGNQNAVGNNGGRPTEYKTEYRGEESCRIARLMAQVGAPEYLIAEALGVSHKTLSVWKAEHVEFRNALEQGAEVINKALVATAIQRALGYTYEAEKVFHTGIKIVHKEHVPPSEKMLQFLLKNRMPEEFSEDKRITPSSDEAFLRALEDMNKRALLERSKQAKPVKLIQHEPT